METSDRRQHAGQDLEAQVLLVSDSIGAPLDDSNLVVEALHETQSDLVLGLAIRRDPTPMALDHRRELLEPGQSLPFERLAPVVEEPPRPPLAAITPQLLERLLEQVGRVETPVGFQQQPEAGPTAAREVLPIGQQGVLLPLDEAPILAGQPSVLALAHLVESLAEVPDDMELVVQDSGLGRVAFGRFGEGLPHVHDGQPDPPARLGAQPGEELVQAFLGTVLAPVPEGTMPNQVADDDPVDVSLALRDLVEADHLRPPRRQTSQLLAHILDFEGFDGAPVEIQFLGHVLDGRCPTTSADVKGEAFGVKRIVRQKRRPLSLHGPTSPAVNPPDLDLQVDPHVAAGFVADEPDFAVVPTVVDATTAPADRFFWCRVRVMTRAHRSPKRPLTVEIGRKPGNRYSSQRRRCRRLERMEL